MAETAFDILIRGGMVLDGTGHAARPADVGIVGERIAAIGDLKQAHAARILAAEGLHVAPGFIDLHTHSDISLARDTGQGSALCMGVTTQVTGNCGLSVALIQPKEIFTFERTWVEAYGAEITWDNFADFHRQAEARGVATNIISLVGHGTLRKRIMGMAERAPTEAEMNAMKWELTAAFEAGAWGFSSGLEYFPSSYADQDELAELCTVVREAQGYYATHLRSEGDTLIEAVQEAIDVAERAGVPLQLSHHKAEGRANWGKVATTLDMVEAARARGLDVQLDQYPYTAFMTSLAIQTLPRWVSAGTHEDTTLRLTDAESRARIAAQMRHEHPDWEQTGPESVWARIQIGVCRTRPELQGLTVDVLAREAGRHPIDFVLDLILETGSYVTAVNFAIGEEDIARVLRYPWTSIGSDAIGTHPDETIPQDQIHPRTYGTFARVLGRYVREQGVISEAEAIHKMTGLPAARLGLQDRGLLAPGMFADIVVYDADAVVDHATFETPHRYSEGMAYVLVNGRVSLANGLPCEDVRAGKVLRRH